LHPIAADEVIDWVVTPVYLLDLQVVFPLIFDGFDDEALSQQQTFRHRHQAVLQIRAQCYNKTSTEGVQ
jgi:hypothetical protein